MIKKLLRIALICLLICQFFTKATAQTSTQHYAVNGTAGDTLIHSVYWLTWAGGTGTTFPSGFQTNNVDNGTYTWNFSPKVRIIATIANKVETTSDGSHLQPYTSGTYFGDTFANSIGQPQIGDGLNILYSGNGLTSAKDPNTGQNVDKAVPNSSLQINNGSVRFDISINVQILVGSDPSITANWKDVNYPGMVIADAESIDAAESIKGHTNGADGWQLLNTRTQGTARDANYVMSFSGTTSNSGQGSDFQLNTINGDGNTGVQAVMFANGVHSLTNLNMVGSGRTAIAIGFVLPFDLGDAPASFGAPTAYINNFVQTQHLPTNGTNFPVGTYPKVTLTPQANVYIGAQNVDADGEPINSTLANTDDITDKPDEDGLPTSNNFVTGVNIKVNQSGDVVLSTNAANLSTSAATLYAWLDFNGDGIFSANEMVSVAVPASTAQGTPFTLTFPNASFKNNIKVGPLYGRLRITTTDFTNTDDATTTVDERSTTSTLDGEVEDYQFNPITGVTISGTVVDDGNGATGGINGTGIQIVGTGAQQKQLVAYLLSTAATPTILAKSQVAADGTYSFSGQNNGNYTVAISTNANQNIGDLGTTAVAALPTGYVPSGATYGANNAAGTSGTVSPLTPNMQIKANTTPNGQDITGVNIGINQIPVTVADATPTPPQTPVNITITANDSDADGTLDLTSILLRNPATNRDTTSVLIVNKGTFNVNTTNGVVTFSPIAGFAGSATLNYTIKDNFGSTSLPASITVTVQPVGTADAATTNMNTPVTTDVKANDGTSGNGTNVIITTSTTTNGGVATVNPNNTVTYTPIPNFVGTDTYFYELQSTDGTVNSAPIRVDVTVLPAGVPDTTQTFKNTQKTIPVEANDGSASTNGSTLNIVSSPTAPGHGVATVSGTSIVYTPVSGFTGVDTLNYTLTTTGGLVSKPIKVTITVLPANSAISLTKAANNTVSAVGRTINYTITAKNTGNTPLTNVVITDAGATNISPASFPGPLAVGATTIFTAQHTVTSGDFSQGRYSNQATVTATDPGSATVTAVSDDPNTTAAGDVTVSLLSPPGAVTLTKSGTYNNGTGIVYTFTVKNTGTVTLTSVSITDPTLNIANAPVTVPAGGLVAGNSATLTITYTVTQADRLTGSVTNTATVNSTDPSGNNTTAQSNTVVTPLPALPVANNDAAIAQKNTPVTVSVLTNDTPDNKPFDLSTVNVVTAPTHGTTTVNPDGTITYTPTTGYSGPDTYTYNVKDQNGYTSNTATVSLTINNYVASMSLTKVAGNGATNAGDIINYAITVTNTGTVLLNNVIVTDANATNVSPAIINSLAAGATANVTAQHTVTPADVSAHTVSNQAAVTAKDPNNNTITGPPSDDPSTPAINDPTITTLATVGTVSLVKSASVAGNIITYTFTVKNTGTVTLNTVSITDARIGLNNAVVNVPAGGLTAGSTAVLTVPYTLTQADKDAGSITNTATVNAYDPSNDLITNSSSIITTFPKSPTAVNDATTAGFNTPVTVAVLANDNPNGSTFNTGSVQIVIQPAHGTATPNANGTITYTPTTGYTGSDSFTYKVADANGYYTNAATVSVTVSSFSAAMTLTKVANNAVSAAGDVINYTITVTNTGNANLTNIRVTDANADAGSVTPATIASLTAGASASVAAKHTVTNADVTAGRVSNQAGVTATDPGGNTINGPFSDDPATPAANDPTVSLISTPGTISIAETGVLSGNIINYTFTIKNTGTTTLTNVTLTDAFLGMSNTAVTTVPSGGLTAGSTVTFTRPYTLTQADKDAGSATSPVTVNAKDPGNNTVTANTTVTTTIPKDVAADDAATVSFNTPKIIAVLTNDTPGNSTFDPTTVHIVSQPTHGAVVTNADGTVTYTPNTNYTGADSFTYQVQDQFGYSTNVATVNITVASFTASMTLTKVANNGAGNVGDVINYTITVTNTGTAALTNVTVTDANADAGSVTPAVTATLAAGASATIAAKHTVTAADVTAGSVSNQANVTAKDPNGNPVTGPPSDNPTTPTPNDPTVTTITPGTGTISIAETGLLSGNIINYTFTIKNTGTTTLTNVTLTDAFLGMSNTAVTTVPSGGLTAGSTVTFTRPYTLTQADKDAGSATSPVTVNAKDPGNNTVTANTTVTTTIPKDVAADDAATVSFNTPKIIAVLTNDTPGNSTFDPTTVHIVSQPTHGAVVTNADGTVTYTPNTNYTGVDSFTYQVQDQFGYSTNVATVNVTVASFTASMTLTKVANNGAGNVGDVINYTITVTNTGTAALTNVTVTDANADAGSVTPAVTATLAAGASVTIAAKHTVTAADVTAGSVSNQANVTAKDPNGNPVTGPPSDNPTTPTPNDPTVTTITPGTGTISLTKTGIFSGNAISYTFTIKNTGTLALTNITLTDANVGLSNTVVAANLAAGATTTYTANYILTQADKDAGTVTNNATVNSKDPNGNTVTANGTVTIPVTKSPTATADAATTGIGQPVIIPVLSNDNSGNTTFNIASVQIVTQPANGTAVANADGSVTYTPNAGYTGSDSFTYKVADSYGYFTNVAPVTINISAPGSISLTKTGVYANTTITYTFTVKNTGPVVLTAITITDAKIGLTAATVTLPIGGLISGATATLTATYTVTQTDKDLGTVTNTATASGKDPIGNTVVNTATVTTTIPKSPVAVNETPTALPGQPVIIPVIKDGTPDNSPFDPTSVQIVTQPQHGTVKVNNDGTITYVPNAGYTGQDTFSYRMKDSNGYFTNIATVTVSVVSTVDLKIPTLFTPNGDGVNDTFEIRGLAKYPNNEVIIVNRWGNEVFRQTNYQNKWAGDGLNEGTYYYILYVKNADGSIFQVLKGWITLLRSTNK